MATVAVEQPSKWIDYRTAFNAALDSKIKIRNDQLRQDVLSSTTRGGRNSLLHLAAGVGNLPFGQQLVGLNSELVKSTNAQGNTALHLAAQGGFPRIVEYLLTQDANGASVCNNFKETPLFKACESGDLDSVKQLFIAHRPSLRQKTVDKRTCLSVVINRGDSDLVDFILKLQDAKDLIQETCKDGDTEDVIQEKYKDGGTEDLSLEAKDLSHEKYRDGGTEDLSLEAKDLSHEKYRDGDTALHLAVARNDVHVMRLLIEIKPQLCYSVNDNKETPLCVAAKLGHLEAVEELIKWGPDAVEIPDKYGWNVLHLAAQVSQVRIVDHLKENVFLLDLVNKGVEKKPPEEKPLQSGVKTDPAEKKEPFSEINDGDTPLHIAARNKNFNMVDTLLHIRGINKFALNKEGLTALDIVRENTEYHESDKIVSVLASYPRKHKPFLHSAPKVSAKKHKVAVKMVDKTFEERRNTELVVAVLLATMSFTAAFTVPGGFAEGEGSPLLLGLDTFKLFLIFDCVAFFLSLFVVLMWQMSTPITTGDKVMFLCITNLLVCATFAFTAYGFMLAVYAMLARKALTLGWVVLGSCIFICTCANFTFFHMVAKFSVSKARFNHLNGLLPYPTDRAGEWVWMKLERCGPLDSLRGWKSKGRYMLLNCKCPAENSPKK